MTLWDNTLWGTRMMPRGARAIFFRCCSSFVFLADLFQTVKKRCSIVKRSQEVSFIILSSSTSTEVIQFDACHQQQDAILPAHEPCSAYPGRGATGNW